MKRITAIILITMIVASVSAQENFLKEFENVKGITSVFVSKSMLGLIPSHKSAGVNIDNIANKLDNVQILVAENAQSAKILKNKFTVMMKNGKYENIMTVNENNEKTLIYMKEFPRGTNQFVLLNTDNSETSIIVVTGKITINDIKDVTSK